MVDMDPKIVFVKFHKTRDREGYVPCDESGFMSAYDITLCLPMFAWEEIYKGFAEVKIWEKKNPALINPDSEFDCIICKTRFRVGDGHQCREEQ